MKNKTVAQLAVSAKEDSHIFDSVMDEAMAFIGRKRLGQAQVQSLRRAQTDDDYPDEFLVTATNMVAAGSLFTRARDGAAFLRSPEGQNLGAKERNLATIWAGVPWLYLCVEMLETHGNDVLSLRIIGDVDLPYWAQEEPGTILVYSPSIGRLGREGSTRFFSLFFRSSQLWQSYGVIFQLPFFPKDRDLFFFADAVAHKALPPKKNPITGLAQRSTDLKTIIARDPIPWLRLLRYSEQGSLYSFNDGEMIFGLSHIRVPSHDQSFEALLEAIDARIEASSRDYRKDTAEGAGVQWEIRMDGGGLGASTIMAKNGKQHSELYLNTTTVEEYHHLREFFLPLADFPLEPMVECGYGAYLAARAILKYSDAYHELQDRFSKATPMDELSKEELSQIQEAMNLMVEAHNSGNPVNIEDISARTGVNPETASDIIINFQQSLKRMGADRGSIAFGLSPKAISQLLISGPPQAPGLCSLNAFVRPRPSMVQQMASCPGLRLAQALLAHCEADGTLALTPSGYLKPTVVRALVEVLPDQLGFLEAQEIKKESDWFWLTRSRDFLEKAGILHNRGKKLYHEAWGKDWGSEIHPMYYALIKASFTTYSWSENPRFEMPSWVPSSTGLLAAAMNICANPRGKIDQNHMAYELAHHFGYEVPPREELTEDDFLGFDSAISITRHLVVSSFFNRLAEPLGLCTIERDDHGFTQEVYVTELGRALAE